MHHLVTINHHGQTLQVSPGDSIELQLEENPTTGYSWTVEEMGPGFHVQQNDYELFSGAGIGGGGRRKMIITVAQPGDGQIRLKNQQPWSGDVYQTFALDVKAGQ